MWNSQDLTNQRFGRLIAISRFCGGDKSKWLCLCDCGKEKVVRSSRLKSGTTKSCGCFRREHSSKSNSTHGLSKTSTYRAWSSMKQRCLNPNVEQYPNYGGRGITLCDRWMLFTNFIEDMGLSPSPAHSIDRIDNNIGYSPENCRWATLIEQANNKRSNRRITVSGETKTVREWSRHLGISNDVIYERLRIGWSEIRAVTEPVAKRTKEISNGFE